MGFSPTILRLVCLCFPLSSIFLEIPICFYLFIFVGFVQLDDSLFVGMDIVLSSSLSLFSTFTITVFDANQCPGSLINHSFVLYFAHLGFVEIVLLLDIACYTFDFFGYTCLILLYV